MLSSKTHKNATFCSTARENMRSLECIWTELWQPVRVHHSWTRGSDGTRGALPFSRGEGPFRGGAVALPAGARGQPGPATTGVPRTGDQLRSLRPEGSVCSSERPDTELPPICPSPGRGVEGVRAERLRIVSPPPPWESWLALCWVGV